MEKEIEIICDSCYNYSVSLCGTSEICSAFIDNQTRFTNEITKEYIEERMIGNKNNCKRFKKMGSILVKNVRTK
jgi:hypothetical protein